MRSGVAVRNRNRHKTDTDMKKQGNLIPCKEYQDTTANRASRLGRKRFWTIRHNNQQQEKTTLLELVRMRSPVQIWIAAPLESLVPQRLQGFCYFWKRCGTAKRIEQRIEVGQNIKLMERITVNEIQCGKYCFAA